MAQLSNPASTDCALQFLQNGCLELKQGFGLDQLLLGPLNPTFAHAVCKDMYWDDTEHAESGQTALGPSTMPSFSHFLHIRCVKQGTLGGCSAQKQTSTQRHMSGQL